MLQLDLGEGELRVDLLIEPRAGTRTRLGLQVLRGEEPGCDRARRVEGGGPRLVAARDAVRSERFVATNLDPGHYHLEIRERRAKVRYRIRLLLRERRMNRTIR